MSLGLDLPEDISREEWLAMGRELGARQDLDRWALGDWARHGDRRYGDLTEAAAEIGLDRTTLYQLARVARKFEIAKRLAISWSHHLVVAALPPDVADGLLQRAEAEGWSVGVTRDEAREASELHRLRQENTRLRRALAEAGTSKAAARRLERQVKDGCRAAGRGVRDLAAVVREAAESPALQALHGNARRALGMRLETTVRNARADTDGAFAEHLLPAVGCLMGEEAE